MVLKLLLAFVYLFNLRIYPLLFFFLYFACIGLNTIYSGSRTLIRKEGAYIPQDPNKTSVPPWIGPQHYPDANKIPAYDKHDGQYRVPFKAAPRETTSEDVQKRQSESRRRRQINEQKQRLSLEESTIGTGSLTSFFTAFDSGVNELDHPVHTKSALEMAKEDKLGEDSVEFDLVLKEDDEDGGSLASSVTLFSRSRTNTSHNHHKKLTVGFLDESIEEVAAAGEQSQSSTPRTPASSLFSQVRSKSILHSTRVRANVPVPKKQARVPNPVYSRKDLTMKLLKLEERGNSNFFKVNDYTMNAFALHSPDVVYQEGFEAADVEAVPDESAGVYQNRSHGPFRKNKPIGPYTSDIFQVKPPEYVAHKPVAAATSVDAAAAASGKLNATPSTKMNRSASSRTGLRLTPLSSTKGARSIATAAIDRPLSRSKEKNTEVLSQDSPTLLSTYTPKILRNDLEAEKNRCERTINKIIQRRHDSRYYGDKKALIDEESVMSAEEAEYHPSGQDLEEMHQSLTTRKSMEKWLDTHDIIRGPIGKRVEGASFLEAHKPLPSIALSLNGLLLDNNPYSLEDEFMKDLFYKPASEIGL